MAKNRLAEPPATQTESMLSQTALAMQPMTHDGGVKVAEPVTTDAGKAITPPVKRGKPQMTPEQAAAKKLALSMEPKSAKFARLAISRGVKAVRAMRQLQHLANRSQYEWTPDQAKAIVNNLQSEIDAISHKFAGNKTNGVTFTL